MNTRTRLQPEDTRSWSKPSDAESAPDAGYDTALRAAIAEGQEDARAGRVKPADQVWKELGLE